MWDRKQVLTILCNKITDADEHTANNVGSGPKFKRKIVDKINIPQAHHRSLPWIGTYTSTKRGVVELEFANFSGLFNFDCPFGIL
jgi:hypothetical protein